MIHNTFKDKRGLRQGDWLFINSNSSEHSVMPKPFKTLRSYKDFESEGLLFNMKDDPEQHFNLYAKYPEKAKKMNIKIGLKLTQEYKKLVLLVILAHKQDDMPINFKSTS